MEKPTVLLGGTRVVASSVETRYTQKSRWAPAGTDHVLGTLTLAPKPTSEFGSDDLGIPAHDNASAPVCDSLDSASAPPICWPSPEPGAILFSTLAVCFCTGRARAKVGTPRLPLSRLLKHSSKESLTFFRPAAYGTRSCRLPAPASRLRKTKLLFVGAAFSPAVFLISLFVCVRKVVCLLLLAAGFVVQLP